MVHLICERSYPAYREVREPESQCSRTTNAVMHIHMPRACACYKLLACRRRTNVRAKRARMNPIMHGIHPKAMHPLRRSFWGVWCRSKSASEPFLRDELPLCRREWWRIMASPSTGRIPYWRYTYRAKQHGQAIMSWELYGEWSAHPVWNHCRRACSR